MTLARRAAAAQVFMLLAACGSGGESRSAAEVAATHLTFRATGGLLTARIEHTATLLPNGQVLVAGGWNQASGAYLSSAELYDPATGTFTPTGSMATPRVRHTATLLPSGKVLVVGGSPDFYVADPFLGSAELYDPATGTFAPTGGLVTPRWGHTATLLPSGKVLVVAGYGAGVFLGFLASAELYDPAAGTFAATGDLTMARVGGSATLLTSGKVLVAGGGGAPDGVAVSVDRADLYDPSSGAFTSTGSLAAPGFTVATPLQDGRVLLTGQAPDAPPSAQLYDPARGAFTATGSMVEVRGNYTATRLLGGLVLVAGGGSRSSGFLSSAELFDPATGMFTPVRAALVGPRVGHTATLLPSGEVLLVGGTLPTPTTPTAELCLP